MQRGKKLSGRREFERKTGKKCGQNCYIAVLSNDAAGLCPNLFKLLLFLKIYKTKVYS